MKIFGKGFNYSQDGPGNRLVYHLQGCNMKCKWCSNPEGIGAFCEKTEEYTLDEIYYEILSARPMFFDGGGVTFTGGEATLWAEELFELFCKLKKEGINICIETNGTYEGLLELCEYTDTLIMDIKHYDGEKHLYWTGDSGERTRRNFERLCEHGKSVLVRIPLINNVNTDAEGFLKFFERFDCRNVSFEFLPYHEYGRAKWVEKYEMNEAFISEEIYNEFKNKFYGKGYKVIRT